MPAGEELRWSDIADALSSTAQKISDGSIDPGDLDELIGLIKAKAETAIDEEHEQKKVREVAAAFSLLGTILRFRGQ